MLTSEAKAGLRSKVKSVNAHLALAGTGKEGHRCKADVVRCYTATMENIKRLKTLFPKLTTLHVSIYNLFRNNHSADVLDKRAALTSFIEQLQALPITRVKVGTCYCWDMKDAMTEQVRGKGPGSIAKEILREVQGNEEKLYALTEAPSSS